MKNSLKKVFLIAFIVIVLLIILYFGGMSFFWNQP
ncbi:putative membrane protein [Bacillus cereus 03BB102]|nr:putative membrane protein [Bacillus cereus 03BB102]